MAKDLIINQTLNECRAALIENGEIIDFVMDRSTDENTGHPSVGNIYKAKVLRVLPGMQSAFVDIGYEKAAFLYVDDAYIPTLEEQREMVAKKTREDAKKAAQVGEIIPDEMSTLAETMDMSLRPEANIEDFLKEGMEIIVQVAKEPISSKGPRVTRHITLAGRYVVFMPYIEHTGVSRRIDNEEERTRLKEKLDNIRNEGQGIIARTVAEGQSKQILKNDYQMLNKIWKDVHKRSKKVKAPSTIYKDLTFVQRVLRDITDEAVEGIVVDSRQNLKEVEKFVTKYLPRMKGKSSYYDGELPIFEQYGVDYEIERGISDKVFLRSGGSLNIDQTEALVSIDVNTGKFVGRKNLEDTILRTNLEAVKEICYQLRLRNCGGIIIIDFIDMQKNESKEMVYQALLDGLKKDRAKTNVLPISGLGLVEMTRKRTRDTLTRILCEPCSYCEGIGRVKSSITVTYELVRELIKVLKKNIGARKVFIYAHPEVTARLCGEELDIIDSLEATYDTNLVIRSENNYHIEQYEIFADE